MSESDLELYGIVGRMFREIRENKGLSLEMGANHLGVTPKSLQRYECGERKIKIGTIKKLCDFYNISYDAFITEAKLRFGANINESTYYSCPECGFSYLTDSVSDIEEHTRNHQAWVRASKKFGKLYCYPLENEKIKIKNRNIRNNKDNPLQERCIAELQVLRCLFSKSIEASGFNLNHVSFDQYVAMMLKNTKYQKNLDDELYQKLVDCYGIKDGIENGESIYYIPNFPQSSKENTTNSRNRIMKYYDMLNDTGKHVAIERVKELTEVPRYTKRDIPNHLKPQAAHNDNETEEQIAKMQEDMSILKRPE